MIIRNQENENNGAQLGSFKINFYTKISFCSASIRVWQFKAQSKEEIFALKEAFLVGEPAAVSLAGRTNAELEVFVGAPSRQGLRTRS